MKKFALFAILASLLLVVPAFANPSIQSVNISAKPGDEEPIICIYQRDIEIGLETGSGVNPLDWRTSLYAFTGERIKYTVVVRDLNGVDDIGYLKAYVNGSEEAIGAPISNLPSECNGLGATNSLTDKAFNITITVESGWNGEMEVLLKVFNSQNVATNATHSEKWFFNPSLSMSVNTSDGNPISFSDMDKVTRVAYSKNKIIVKNNSTGGVNIWVFIAGSNLFATNGSAKCPDSNYIDIEKYMWYRAWKGTGWQGWQGWVNMSRYNENDGCKVGSSLTYNYWDDTNGNGICDVPTEYNKATKPTCYGGLPAPMPDPDNGDDILEHILTNNATLEIEFKIKYPIPCIGTFNNGTIYIIGKAM